MGIKVNIGCGNDYLRGFKNCDINKSVKADAYFDMNVFPWPFKENECDEVIMRMSLEHCADPIAVLKEVIQICSDKAEVIITVPHANSNAAKTDIQHKTFFTENSFTDGLLKEYGLEKLRLINFKYVYNHKWKRFIPFKKALNVFLGGIYDDLEFIFQIVKN